TNLPSGRIGRLKGRRRVIAGAAGVLALAGLGLSLLLRRQEKGTPPPDKQSIRNFIAQFDSAKPLPSADTLRQHLDDFLTNFPELEEDLRQALVACWWRHLGTERAPQAGALLMRLRSPLDLLDREKIPSGHRVASLRNELVAVVNDPEALSQDNHLFCAAV